MLAASFFSDQAGDVRYWPEADMTCFLGTAHRAFCFSSHNDQLRTRRRFQVLQSECTGSIMPRA